MSLLSYLYMAFLYLYPAAFRKEFETEMKAVFADAVEEACSQGGIAPVRVFIREVASLPGNLIRLHWAGIDWLPFDAPDLDPWANLPGSWRAALLAGLPHLLYPLSIYLPIVTSIFLGLWPSARPAQSPFWILTVILLVFAWSRGWPRWSSSWIGYGLVFVLDRIAVNFRSGWPAQAAFIAWFLLAIWIIYRLARRDWLSSLLAVLPVAPMWIWWIGLQGGMGLLSSTMLYTSIGFSVFIAVAATVRIGRWQTAVLLVLAVLLAIGQPGSAMVATPGILSTPYMPAPINPSGGGMSHMILLLLLTAPLWLLAFWRHVRRQDFNGFH
jgi:hypothetical protein